MLGLPKTTEFNKRIPKQKFYDNLAVTPALKKVFTDQIKTICWRNKIADSTTNLASGTAVTELEVFEVKLNSQILDDSFLRQMDKEIPYHILFILEYEGKYKAVIGYKEESYGNTAFKVNRYYSTEWMDEDALPLKLEGLSVDSVYENFVRQIAGDTGDLHLVQAVGVQDRPGGRSGKVGVIAAFRGIGAEVPDLMPLLFQMLDEFIFQRKRAVVTANGNSHTTISFVLQ